MEGFRINLKSFLSLAMPNQYCLTVRKQILSWFWSNLLGLKTPNPIYSATVLYDDILNSVVFVKKLALIYQNGSKFPWAFTILHTFMDHLILMAKKLLFCLLNFRCGVLLASTMEYVYITFIL